MKKSHLTLLATLLSYGALSALPIGNASEAALYKNGVWVQGTECSNIFDPCFSWLNCWSFRLGFYGNYVFERNLEVAEGDLRKATIEHTELFTNAGYLALNVCNRVDLFATLGGTTIRMDLDSRIVNNDPYSLLELPNLPYLSRLTFDPAFSWSVGARALLWECGCFDIGLEGEYFRTSPRVNYLTGLADALYSFDEFKATYSEWQVGLAVSYTIATRNPSVAFVPYLALAWSEARLQSTDLGPHHFEGVTGDLFLPALQSAKLWSYAVGTSFTLCEVVGVTAEGRFGAETALSIIGEFRF